MSTLSGGTYVEFITRVLLAADAMRRPNKNSHVTWPASLVHLIGACEWEERIGAWRSGKYTLLRRIRLVQKFSDC